MGLFSRAEFFTTVNHLRDLPLHGGREVAFAGRSNAGKSSAINTLANHTRLAFTSKTPGRTQHINYFSLGENRYLVDLPGYGYAKVAEQVKLRWQQTLEDYLRTRESLAGLVLLMDVRHPLKEFDCQMLDWCLQSGMPVHVLLTKSDKLKRGAGHNALHQVRRYLEELGGECSAQLFSSLNRTGVEQLVQVLDRWLEYDKSG